MTKSDTEGAAPDSTGAEPPDSGTALIQTPASATGDVQTYIGARLRRAFDDIASQPVPDRFLELMRELDKA